MVERFPALSRRELDHTIFEYLGWFTPQDETRIQSGLRLLEALEKLGIVRLPEKRAKASWEVNRVDLTCLPPTPQEINDGLSSLTP